jgi:hypothetical protein
MRFSAATGLLLDARGRGIDWEAESASANGKLGEKEKPLTQDGYFTQKWSMPPGRPG